MTIRALVIGTLHGEPKLCTSKQGRAYATAKMKADGKDGAVCWCSVIVFDEEQAERLAGLNSGDSVAVSGSASMSIWKDKVWFELKADGVLPLKKSKRKRRPDKEPPPASTRGEPFDDLDEWLAV